MSPTLLIHGLKIIMRLVAGGILEDAAYKIHVSLICQL